MLSPRRLWPALLLADAVNAAKWTITSVYIQTVMQYTYTDEYADETQTITTSDTRNTPVTLKPSVTITATPVSAYTTTSSSSYYDGNSYVYGDGSDDVVYIQRFYPPGAIPTSDLTSSVYDYQQWEFTTTYFFQTIELTAPSSCPTPFTVTTTTEISVPSQVADQVSLKSATTSISTDQYNDADAYTYTFVSAYLASTSHPSGAAATRNSIYRAYMTDCRNPDPTRTSSPGPTGDGRGGSSNGDSMNQALDVTGSCAWSNCSNTPYWGIIVITVLSTIFLVGFFESYHWFTCLMSGEGALRGGTILWILLCLPCVFLTRHIPARNAEDQERLRAQWAEKTISQKFSLWRRWGLRYRYPMELLGVHPEYTYGNPVKDEKLVDDWYGENGDRPQVPATYMYNAAGQMAMAPPQNQSQTPQLPPRARLRGLNNGSLNSDSVLPPVLEESGLPAAEDEGKGWETGPRTSDVQAGPAPKVEDDMKERSAETRRHEDDPKGKDNSS